MGLPHIRPPCFSIHRGTAPQLLARLLPQNEGGEEVATKASLARTAMASLMVTVLIAIASAVVLAIGAFMLGSVQGEIRPAASDREIAIYDQGDSLSQIGLALLGIGALGILVRAVVRDRLDKSRTTVVVHDISVFALIVVVLCIGAWMVGKTFFAIPTTM